MWKFLIVIQVNKRKWFLTQRLEEDRVTALVQGEKILANRRQTVQHLQDLCSLYYLRRNTFHSSHSANLYTSIPTHNLGEGTQIQCKYCTQ